MTTTSLQEALSCAAEDIRRACLATLAADALQDPREVYEALAELQAMTHRLPQLARQISGRLVAAHGAGKVAHVSGGDALQSVTTTGARLAGAAGAAETVADLLASAQNEATHLKAAE